MQGTVPFQQTYLHYHSYKPTYVLLCGEARVAGCSPRRQPIGWRRCASHYWRNEAANRLDCILVRCGLDWLWNHDVCTALEHGQLFPMAIAHSAGNIIRSFHICIRRVSSVVIPSELARLWVCLLREPRCALQHLGLLIASHIPGRDAGPIWI